MIPGCDPHADYIACQQEIDDAIARVCNSGHYILGDEVRAFEDEFASYLGTADCAGVASGTDAIMLSLAACDTGAGDEVITVSHTAVATATAIVQAGATPVFVDVDPDSYTLDVTQLEQACSERTSAIVVVHLYGQPADMSTIMTFAAANNIRVIEDCAQAHGAMISGRRVGTFGDLAAFSFYPTKNLGCMGDGGAVVSNDADLIEKVKLLRQYGWRQRFISDVHGWNSRLDEMQAAILRVKLRYLDEANARRRAVAGIYTAGLENQPLVLPVVKQGLSHVYHQYVVRLQERDALLDYLRSDDVMAGIHYPVPVHQQPAYQQYTHGELPVTEELAGSILSLPIYPALGDGAHEVVEKVHAFYS